MSKCQHNKQKNKSFRRIKTQMKHMKAQLKSLILAVADVSEG